MAGYALRQDETAAGEEAGRADLTGLRRPVRSGEGITADDTVKAHVVFAAQAQQIVQFGHLTDEDGRPLDFGQAARLLA